jgi:membrane fusion protein (multidrug efflux system)
MTLPFRSARPHHAQRYLVLLLSFLWISSAWAVPVTVAIVKTSTWTQTVSVMGQVKSVGQVTMTAPMTGRVIGPFQPAGMLSPGAVIARIDPPGLQARIQAAQAQTDYARIALQRDQRLLRDGVVAIATVDSSRVAWQQAIATSRALQAEQSDQSLIAPFAGSIDYLVTPGVVVMAGTPIATLSGREMPWVASLVPPQTAFHLTVGSPVHLQAGPWQGTGRIRSIGSSARQSGLVSVVITLPANTPLLPGEWISVHLQVPKKQAVAVPVAAVVMHGAHALVYVDDQGHARPVSIKVLGTEHGIARIVGDLKAGEQVVMSGNTRLNSHAPLEIQK